MHSRGEVTVKSLVLPTVLAALLAGCSGAAVPAGTPTTTAPGAAAASTPGSPDAESAGQERALPIYYVAQTAAGPRLQREFHRLPADDPGSAAVREMLAHPTGTDPDYHNPWPAGTTLRAPVTSTAEAVTVDLSVAPPPDPLATQELIFTVQGALGVTTPVRLLHGGVPVGPPIPRGDVYALRSLVQIDRPADGTSTTSPLTVDGEAAVFEATVHWSVESGGKVLRTGVAATAEGQVFSPFQFSLALPPGRYTVRISEDDPSDGVGRPVLTDDRTVVITAS
jgi:hypothetical protein